MKKNKIICFRCGKERIIVKVWKEKVWDSVIENTETICSDKECQKSMEKEINAQRKNRLQREEKKKEHYKNIHKHAPGK